MTSETGRRLLLSVLAAALVIGAGLGPGRPFLLAAVSTVYAAWLYTGYLFRSVPGAFWWTAASLVVSIMIIRRAVAVLLRHRSVSGSRPLWPASLRRRKNTSRSRERLHLMRRQLTEIGEHPSATAFIDRELADILSRMLRGGRWTRGGAQDLADHPVLSHYPELRKLAAEGPVFDSSQHRDAGGLFGRTRDRQKHKSEMIARTEQHIKALEAIADHREYQKHHA